MTISAQSNITEFHPNKYFVITSHYDLLGSIDCALSLFQKREVLKFPPTQIQSHNLLLWKWGQIAFALFLKINI